MTLMALLDPSLEGFNEESLLLPSLRVLEGESLDSLDNRSLLDPSRLASDLERDFPE